MKKIVSLLPSTVTDTLIKVKLELELKLHIMATEGETKKCAFNEGPSSDVDGLCDEPVTRDNYCAIHAAYMDVAKTAQATRAASKPEPAPIRGGVDIYPLAVAAVKALEDQKSAGEGDAIRDMLRLLSERHEFGVRKYGQTLMSHDGRDAIVDAEQELGDFVQYFVKARYLGLDIGKLKQLLQVVNALVASEL